MANSALALSVFACARPSVKNGVVQIVSARSPWRSSSIESWIHHDVQPPQSPEATMTEVHSFAMRCRSGSPAGVAAFNFS